VLLHPLDGEGSAGGSELLSPSGGWKPVWTTPGLVFRALISEDRGELEVTLGCIDKPLSREEHAVR